MKYLGNKSRLEAFLAENLSLENRSGQTALDLFSGTGFVSLLFKKHGINTVSNDSISFCAHRARAILLDKHPKPLEGLNTSKLSGFVTNHYSEKVGINIFKTDIAEHIDGSRVFLSEIQKNISREEYSYYLSQIIESADFRSNIMGSYESFYKKGWRKQALSPWAVNPFELFDTNGSTQHEVYNADAIDFILKTKEKFDFIYIDPPYNSRQYSSVFHVPETICLYNNPETTGKVKKSVHAKEKNSNFSSKRNYLKSFEDLVNACGDKCKELFMSYSTEGLADVKEIKFFFEKNFKDVQVYSQKYRRFKTNSRKDQKEKKLEEMIFHGSK